jgi:hypothetical protein
MNISKVKVQLQIKTAVQSALGQSVTWKPVSDYWCRIIPVDVKTIAAYQALDTVVTHRIVFDGTITISLGIHRIVKGTTVYTPATTAQHLGESTVVMVVGWGYDINIY